jgi:hypothetical protein
MKSPEEAPLGSIPLTDAQVEPADAVIKKEHCFSIVTDGRTFYICADDKDTMRSWMDAVAARCDALNNRRTRALTASSVNLLSQLPDVSSLSLLPENEELSIPGQSLDENGEPLWEGAKTLKWLQAHQQYELRKKSGEDVSDVQQSQFDSSFSTDGSKAGTTRSFNISGATTFQLIHAEVGYQMETCDALPSPCSPASMDSLSDAMSDTS